MARRRKSKYLAEYQKERRRVSRLINRYKNKGYDVEIKMPPIPKTVTQASIRRLKKYTPRYISEHSYAPHLETGEVITVREYVARGFNRLKFDLMSFWQFGGEIPEIEKPSIQQPKVKPEEQKTKPSPTPEPPPEGYYAGAPSEPGPVAYADVVIANFEELISQYPRRAYELAYNFYQSIASKLTRDELAEFLDSTYEAGLWVTPEEAYRGEKLQENLLQMMKLLELSGGEKSEILNEIDMETDFYEDFLD